LIAAISGRALAAAARRAGYRPLVADFFGDADTVAMAERVARLPGDLRNGIDGQRLLRTLRELAGGERPMAVVLGSGFEAKTELVDEVAAHFPLAGNRAETIRRIKDPYLLSADCSDLGIPHPDVQRELPPDPENWVVKSAGGAGGTHIRRANGEPPGPRRYFQRHVAGQSISALFIGDGERASVIGFSRQWTSRSSSAPYRYGGAARLRRFSQTDATMIGDWVSRLTRRAGLLGLCSADLVRASDGYRLIEINPRPGATLDIFDSDEAPLMEAHLRGVRGETYRLPRFADSMASMIVYTSRPIPSFPAVAWPQWTADRQSPGTELIAGDPICTVFARGPSAAVTRQLAWAQARQLQEHWEGGRT
jgi:uncharacterized protein